jgi:hypothetical protein
VVFHDIIEPPRSTHPLSLHYPPPYDPAGLLLPCDIGGTVEE